MKNEINFFLGANSNKGFISYFKQLQEQSDSMQLLILKGGPGSGKSSLMKRILSFATQKGHLTETIPCASDPTSLDAMIDYSQGFAIMDGTSPHTEDPAVVGALHHIIYTGDLWDTGKLFENRADIISLNRDISSMHKAAGAYIRAGSALLEENIRQSGLFVRSDEVRAFVNKFFPRGTECKQGKEITRLLSGVSVGGIKVFSHTLNVFSDKIYVLDDIWGGASDRVMKSLYTAAKLSGEEIIHCPCSVMPQKTDHLILPQRRIAFATKNALLPINTGEEVSCRQFYGSITLTDGLRQRLNDARELFRRASAMVTDAKNLHDELEAIYVRAMNFDGMEKIYEGILQRFYNFS